MKILVTGGAGFIGSHVVDRLVQEGHRVAVVDNLSTGKRRNLNRSARFYKMDIQSSRLERVFSHERPVLVMHLAAQMNVRRSTDDPEFDARVNILGTLNLIKHAIRHGTRKVVFASSGGAVYGEQTVYPAPESHLTHPLSPYGVSKLAGEHYLAYYQHVAGLRSVALRYSNVYGPCQEPEGEAGVVAIFAKKMLRGEQPIINGNGRQTRDYLFVDDAVGAAFGAMEQDVQGVYNVGTGQETSVNDIFRSLKALTKASCKERHGPAKKGEQLRSVLDTTKIRRELEWEPDVSFQNGLERTVEFFKSKTR